MALKEPLGPFKEVVTHGLFPLDAEIISALENAAARRGSDPRYPLDLARTDLATRNELLHASMSRNLALMAKSGALLANIFLLGAGLCHTAVFFSARSRGLVVPIVEQEDLSDQVKMQGVPSVDVLNHLFDIVTKDVSAIDNSLLITTKKITAEVVGHLINPSPKQIDYLERIAILGVASVYNPIFSAAKRPVIHQTNN